MYIATRPVDEAIANRYNHSVLFGKRNVVFQSGITINHTAIILAVITKRSIVITSG
jgi:hypothetical protein